MEQNNEEFENPEDGREKVRLRKIPTSLLLEILSDLFEQGVDFIDIVGTPDAIQDSIGISFTQEYMSLEAHFPKDETEESGDGEDNDDDDDEALAPPEIIRSFNIDLSNEDDINQLL